MSKLTYEEACVRAAHDQGLDVVAEALSAANCANFIEQTGGFTMVLTVTRGDGTWGVTVDGPPTEDRRFLVVWYPGDQWAEGDVGEYAAGEPLLTLEEVLRRLTAA